MVQAQRPGLSAAQAPSSGTATCGRAVSVRPCSIWASVKPGFTAHINDATAATAGAAKLVPDAVT